MVVYRTNPITAALARRLLKILYVSLPNLLLGREAQPELLQQDCTAPRIAEAAGQLLSDAAARAALQDAYREVVSKLTPPGAIPSHLAARKLLDLLAR